MTRISKQQERRAQSPRKHKAPAKKTGPKKDQLEKGFKEHSNALEGAAAEQAFFPKL